MKTSIDKEYTPEKVGRKSLACFCSSPIAGQNEDSRSSRSLSVFQEEIWREVEWN